MTPFNIPDVILRTAEQINALKQQIEETTDPKERRRLRLRLKEIQILQQWQMEKEASDEITPG
jgi:hypothetical protein